MKFYKTIFFLLLFIVNINAQKKLTGKVVDHNNNPVVNAKIYLDSLDSKVETNRDGNFEVLLPEKLIDITIKSKKYGLLSSKYSNEDTMNFTFLETVKPKKSSGNDSKNLDVEHDKNAGIYRNIYELIRGRLPGVSVSNDNSITIRGVNSLRYTAEPLFVVDGVNVSSIDYILPNNVKKISVLKGADAAVYGLQGSSGVILITTK
jgi:TonB-dependent SusC/RagA subfamily outer membrane receptor